MILNDGTHKTLVRALQGGEIRLIDGLVRDRPDPTLGISVSAQHSAKFSISKILLEQLGATNVRIRTNASGKTRELSFRDLARNILINETKIQEISSPVLSGQYIAKTAETSVFKYMLTGVDDSALDLAKPDPAQPLRQAAQLELLDKQMREIDHEISESDQDHEELLRLDRALDEKLNRSFELQESTEVSYRRLSTDRRDLMQSYESSQDKINEVDTLLARFSLLSKHYTSDEQRLASIIEAGAFFMLEDVSGCPVCGADAEHFQPHHACEGDVLQITVAASAEAEELKAAHQSCRQRLPGSKRSENLLHLMPASCCQKLRKSAQESNKRYPRYKLLVMKRSLWCSKR
jgi:hypothetical protein